LHDVAVSDVAQAEPPYGVAKRGHPQELATRVHEFLVRVDILPWTQDAARIYDNLRAACEASRVTLATRDRAFGFVPNGSGWQDWTT